MLCKKFSVAALMAALMLCAGLPARADDIEIYTTQDRPPVKSNLLLVFDTSGSMNWPFDVNETGIATDQRRLGKLKKASHTALDLMADVNVGLMRYNHSTGASVAYPVRDLETSGAVDKKVTLRAVIAQGEDDVSECLVKDEHDKDNDKDKEEEILINEDLCGATIGLRYQGINIPRGAKITKAYLDVASRSQQNHSTELTIQAEKSADSAPLKAGALGSRSKTTAKVTWTIGSDLGEYDYYRSESLVSVVQEVVDQADWCGENALTLLLTTTSGGRRFAAFETTDRTSDNHTPSAPLLTVEYDETAPALAGSSCYIGYTAAQVNYIADDAEESSTGVVLLNERQLDYNKNEDGARRNKLFAVRFRELKVPKGAEVLGAELVVANTAPIKAENTLTVQGVAAADAPAFTSTAGSLSALPPGRSDQTTIEIPPANEPNEADSILSLEATESVKAIIAGSGWASGKSLALVVKGTAQDTAEKELHLHSRDGKPKFSPRLSVRYRMKDKPYVAGAFTVRQALKNEINALVAEGPTPTAEALLEAYNYLAGRSVDFGLGRVRANTGRISHPDSYKGGTVTTPDGCPGSDSNSKSCKDEAITNSSASTATYITPIDDACEQTSVTVLSDGAPNQNDQAASKIERIAGGDSCSELNDGGAAKECSYRLARYMSSGVKFNRGLDKVQQARVNTIGYRLPNDSEAQKYMKALASAGGGSYTDVNSEKQLVKALLDSPIGSRPSAGRMVGIPLDVGASGAYHRDEVYLPLFQASDNIAWLGNLKRYRFDSEMGIADRNNKAVFSGGEFASGAKSWWSDEADGGNIAAGGAASKLSADRQVYSDLGTGGELEQLNAVNNKVTKELLGNVTDAERDAILKWVKGEDQANANKPLKRMGDVLHSTPTVVTYNNGTADSRLIFAGTNDGFLHAINDNDGSEHWSFYPKALLGQLKQTVEGLNTPGGHQYGLDGPISVFLTNDVDKDGVIDQGDTAYLYVGMRRGGKNYYAFDISNPEAISLKFVIEGGTGNDQQPGRDYSKLGESWSKLSPARVRFGDSGIKNVLIAGGGYDTAQDSEGAPLTTEQLGSDVYMFDAENGDILWRARSNSADASGVGSRTTMIHSIPANIGLVSMVGDGVVDHLYVTDLGGQIFRFDLGNDAMSAKGGRIAHLQDGTEAKHNRRFYNAPSIAYIKSRVGNRSFMAISVGSGYRAHPKDTVIEEHMYSLRDYGIVKKPTPLFDKDIELGDLLNLKDYEGDKKKADGNEGSDGESDAAQALNVTGPNRRYGWYLPFGAMGEGTKPGEKVLNAALVVNGKLRFTTYYPTEAADACSSSFGKNRSYYVDVRTGDPGNFQISTLTPSDKRIFKANERYRDMSVEGIATGPQAVVLPYNTQADGSTSGGLCVFEGDGRMQCEPEGLRLKPFKREQLPTP